MSLKQIGTHLCTLGAGIVLTLAFFRVWTPLDESGAADACPDQVGSERAVRGPAGAVPESRLEPADSESTAVDDWELRLCRARLVSLEGAPSDWTTDLREMVGPDSTAVGAVERDLLTEIPDAFDLKRDCDEYPCLLTFRVPAELQLEHPGPTDVAMAEFRLQFEEQAPFQEMRDVLSANHMGGGTLSCSQLGSDQIHCGFAAGMAAGSGPDAYQRTAARLKTLMSDVDDESDTGAR